MMKKALISILALAAVIVILGALYIPSAARGKYTDPEPAVGLDQEPDGTPVEIPWEDGIKPGDVNGDSFINKKDSLALKKYLADNTLPIDLTAADVFKDGAINKKDSLRLKQYLAGWDVVLGA